MLQLVSSDSSVPPLCSIGAHFVLQKLSSPAQKVWMCASYVLKLMMVFALQRLMMAGSTFELLGNHASVMLDTSCREFMLESDVSFLFEVNAHCLCTLPSLMAEGAASRQGGLFWHDSKQSSTHFLRCPARTGMSCSR